MKPGKIIAAICLLGIVILAGWEAIRLYSPTPGPAPIPVPAPAPILVAPPPAPAALLSPAPPTVSKPQPAPPAKKVKKPIPVKKVLSAAVTPVPVIPIAPETPPPTYVPAPLPPEPQEWKGTDTSITHVGQIVIRNDHQWIHFWSEHHPHEAAPEVDFTQDMVIGVFAGPRPAEQFSISILNARSLPGSVIVDYRERLPPPGTFAVNVTVYPYDLKVIPRTTLPVKFNVLEPENVVR